MLMLSWLRLGVAVQSPGTTTARGILLMTTVDLPARTIVLNMKNFNGRCRCCYCDDTGEFIPPNHLHRFWPPRAANTRTHQTMVAAAKKCHSDRLEAVSILI